MPQFRLCDDEGLVSAVMIAHLNGKVGGIMFWAVNEGASGGPNGNGQTTGANSVALANYAAAL